MVKFKSAIYEYIYILPTCILNIVQREIQTQNGISPSGLYASDAATPSDKLFTFVNVEW